VNRRSTVPSNVVVTGVGVVAGLLCGVERLAETIRNSTMPCSEVDRRAGYHAAGSARLAVQSAGVDLSSWVTPMMGRRMSLPSKLAVAASRMALSDTGLLGQVEGPRTAVVMSNALGATDCTERLLRSSWLEGPEAVSPFVFAESVQNAAAAQIAIDSRAQGSNLTIVQREAGILTAVGRGAAEITAGRADRALVGGVEEMPPLMHALLDRMDSLARPDSDGGEVARPFDRRRSGFVAAEGAVVLVLEREDQARSRGARIRARVRASASAFDPTGGRVGWGRGDAALSQALRRLLHREGLTPVDIGQIVSGACGSIAGDRLEARTLRGAWDDAALPPVLAPKGVTGQYGGGFLAAAVLAAAGDAVGATAGFSEPDPDLDVIPYQGGRLPASPITVVTSVASGGAASWLLLERM
jgi:3-oxoacyl-[acyl-carrier-protein] synthase II